LWRNKKYQSGGTDVLNQRHVDWYEKIGEIEDRISKYEQASQYLNDVQQQLYEINVDGFEEEISEIHHHIHNLQSKETVVQLMNNLNRSIQHYIDEHNQLQHDCNRLPSDVVDLKKRDEIQSLLSSAKTIDQARKWINDIQVCIQTRDRICFPKELTQYCDEYLIGTGGFSRVYRVKNIENDQIVAVKIPIKNDEAIGKSLLRELNNWVSLKHKNIVKIYKYNILPIPYIEMEWCDSCLENIKKPVQFNLALHYIHEIAEGLMYAHERNVAHFDLKPQNILLKDDVPKISDWGLSRLLTKQGTTTIGISLPFAAPEQFSSKYGDKDTRTDIWQLGVLFYHILTNEIPFSGNDFAEYGKNILSKNIRKMISDDTSLKDVAHILTKCLAKQKDDRYENMRGFLSDIEDIM